MRDWVRRLSDTSEIVLVLFIGFGYFIFNSVRHFFQITTSDLKHWSYSFNNFGGVEILTYELISGLIIYFILKERGWTLKDFNLNIRSKSFLHGFILVIVTLLVLGLTNFLIFKTGLLNLPTESMGVVKYENNRNWIVWGLLIVFNSVFEECLYIGYLHKRLADNKVLFLGVSTGVRVVMHLYQGIFNIIPMVIGSLVYGTYYLKWRQLAPIIIGHGLWNLFWISRIS